MSPKVRQHGDAARVNLDIEDGEFAVFVGPSGCGKSTLLRMIAGLEEVSEGEVLIGDEVMNDVVPAAAAWRWSSSPMRSIRT